MTATELRHRLALIWEGAQTQIRPNVERLCHELRRETQVVSAKVEAACRERDIAREESGRSTAEAADLRIELQRTLQLLHNSEMECRRLKHLARFGWDKKTTEVSPSMFDHVDDEAADEAAVQFFLEKIGKGEPLPMPVLSKETNGRCRVVDGRARIVAAKRWGATTISAYVVTLSSPEVFLAP